MAAAQELMRNPFADAPYFSIVCIVPEAGLLTKIKQENFFGITRGRRLIRIKAFVASLPIILVPDFCSAQSPTAEDISYPCIFFSRI
jgi:hypothetical protein